MPILSFPEIVFITLGKLELFKELANYAFQSSRMAPTPFFGQLAFPVIKFYCNSLIFHVHTTTGAPVADGWLHPLTI